MKRIFLSVNILVVLLISVLGYSSQIDKIHGKDNIIVQNFNNTYVQVIINVYINIAIIKPSDFTLENIYSNIGFINQIGSNYFNCNEFIFRHSRSGDWTVIMNSSTYYDNLEYKITLNPNNSFSPIQIVSNQKNSINQRNVFSGHTDWLGPQFEDINNWTIFIEPRDISIPQMLIIPIYTFNNGADITEVNSINPNFHNNKAVIYDGEKLTEYPSMGMTSPIVINVTSMKYKGFLYQNKGFGNSTNILIRNLK